MQGTTWPEVPEYFGLTKKREVKALVGWGGISIRDPQINPLRLLKNYLAAVQEHSCGRCVPCRIGSKIMLDTVTRIIEDGLRPGDLDQLASLSNLAVEGSACEFGRSFPKPVLDLIRQGEEAFTAGTAAQEPACRQVLVTSPCRNRCPIHLDVPRYVEDIKEGAYEKALKGIREKTFLAGTLGAICDSPCETACRRKSLDQALNIHGLKGFAARAAIPAKTEIRPGTSRPQRVAVVGGGPAGLSAAYRLALEGFKVTVFEAAPSVGGLLTAVLKERLPRETLQNELNILNELGVEIKTGLAPGQNLSWPEFNRQEFDALLLACGLNDFPGEVEGLAQLGEKTWRGLDFLKQVNSGLKPDLSEDVLVVGSGHLAEDCRRAAAGLGARVTSASSAAEAQAMVKSPRDTVIMALRGGVSAADLPEGVSVGPGGLIEADPYSLATAAPGVFAAGEAVIGPSSLVEAIAGGNRAAAGIKEYLLGEASGATEEDELEALAAELGVNRFACNSFIAYPSRQEQIDTGALARQEAERCIKCQRLALIVT